MRLMIAHYHKQRVAFVSLFDGSDHESQETSNLEKVISRKTNRLAPNDANTGIKRSTVGSGVIGKLDFEKLTQQLFVKFETVSNDNDILEFSHDGAEFVFKEETSGQCQVIYKLSAKAFPIEEIAE